METERKSDAVMLTEVRKLVLKLDYALMFCENDYDAERLDIIAATGTVVILGRRSNVSHYKAHEEISDALRTQMADDKEFLDIRGSVCLALRNLSSIMKKICYGLYLTKKKNEGKNNNGRKRTVDGRKNQGSIVTLRG